MKGQGMKKRDLELGDIVQLNPDHGKFPGFLVVVTEVKSWGCQGYLMSAYDFVACKFLGRAFVRPRFEDFEYVGKIVWDADVKNLEEEFFEEDE